VAEIEIGGRQQIEDLNLNTWKRRKRKKKEEKEEKEGALAGAASLSLDLGRCRPCLPPPAPIPHRRRYSDLPCAVWAPHRACQCNVRHSKLP
jgi:hypothetical protein